MIVNPEERLYKYCPTCKANLEVVLLDGRDRLKCPDCTFIFWSNPKPCVSLIIHKGDEVLMVQRAKEPLKGYWCLPGGFLEYEETPEVGLRREVKEELRIDVNLEKLIGVYQIDNDPRGMHLDIIFAGTTNDQAKHNQELSDCKFFHKDQLPENIAYKHREAISDYFQMI